MNDDFQDKVKDAITGCTRLLHRQPDELTNEEAEALCTNLRTLAVKIELLRGVFNER
jgi:hypothetical protein